MELHIENMTCGGCANAVHAAIRAVDAQTKVQVDPPSRTVHVETSASIEAVQSTLAEAGFTATLR